MLTLIMFVNSQFALLLPAGVGRQHFIDQVFKTLDLDGDGFLNFKEYVLALDLVDAKTPEAKLKWTFKV